MLIPESEVIHILRSFGLTVNGVLHIGAHECEEMQFYKNLGVSANNMIWIDAIQTKVDEAKNRNIPNVFQAVVTNKDDDDVVFHITNNAQSSSVLDFGSHARHHPHVHFIQDVHLKTVTIDSFMSRNSFNPSKYDFWNFDIQGAELMALHGARKALEFPKAIYLEVNTEEVYKGCGRLSEIDTFLGAYNFIRVKTQMTEFGWGDALYVKK